ncbi:hypothetical protein F2Q69_00012976 [Brassica cretica]|uniref:Uncharacterized protein n=1 Tax=Brassica cretica TaxID=69181 RepID=A0A8S9R2R5_BRACR|nr:hypothetical protein F2Q69_00012976 [Brassica cretica]
MEDMDFGRTTIDEEIGISIDGAKATSIDKSTELWNDKSTELSIDKEHQTSIDNTPPEAASEGNFNTRNPEEAKRLIKNIATGRSYEMMDETGESGSRPIDLDDPSTESAIPQEKQKPNIEEEDIKLEEEEGEIEEDAEIDRQGRTSVDRQNTVNIDRPSENNVD